MLSPELLLVAGIVFVAVLAQSVVGFGLALVSMPLLVGLLGIRVAAPLVALVALLTEIVMIAYYRESLRIDAIKELAIGSVIGIPLGVLALKRVDEMVITILLGVLVAGYGLYGLLTPRLPEIRRRGWGYFYGLAGGLLAGAYNTGGPPLIIYGNCRRWPPGEFKSNLQALFLLHSTAVLIAHVLERNFTPEIVKTLVPAVPAALAGMVLGFALDRIVSPEAFRKIVLVALIVLGINLLI